MSLSKFTYVEYEPAPDRFGRTHTHLLQIGDGVNSIYDTNIESVAEELAETVARCTEDRHEGHGFTHSDAEVEEAYRTAVMQLLTRDYDKEQEEIERGIRRQKKWGGPVPEMVLFPDAADPKKWNILVTDKEGNAFVYPVRKEAQALLHEALPSPDQVRGTHPTKSGLGWKVDRRFKPRYDGR